MEEGMRRPLGSIPVDFSVEHYKDKLEEIDGVIRNRGSLVLTATSFSSSDQALGRVIP